MGHALDQAAKAADIGEVPVGAVLVSQSGQIVSATHNAPLTTNDPSAHAEMLAIRDGANKIGNYRLTDYTLVVTLEPCMMCLGAMIHARIGGLVFGARDPKSGALVSCLEGADLPFVNHHFPYLDGIRADECSSILKEFFKSRRKKRSAAKPNAQ